MRIISLGWGLQSFALAAMAAEGWLPSVDAAVFADTGHEREGTYAFAGRWAPWLEARGVRVVTVRAPRTDAVEVLASGRRAVQIPAYGADGSMIRRQCTGDWKVAPIKRWLRAELGGRLTPGCVDEWLGITTDEATRCKPSPVGYIVHRWPLVERGLSRADVEGWLVDRGLEVPPRSACVMCPFQSGAEWASLSAGDLAHAARVDAEVRHATKGAATFVHRRRVPLLLALGLGQSEGDGWDNECSGFCHS